MWWPGLSLEPVMPVILTGNFLFWQAKNDQFGLFYIISAHFGPLLTILDGHSFKKMMGNFRILAKALVVADNINVW